MESKSTANHVLSKSRASSPTADEAFNNFSTDATQHEGLDAIWRELGDSYVIKSILGSGSFGTVAAATHIETNTNVAIKLLLNACGDKYNAKQIICELEILRKLSSIKDNCYTSRIFDIITKITWFYFLKS